MLKKILKEPSCKEAQKCIAIRRKRKLGLDINEGEYKYCLKMYGRYPNWYLKIEERIFNHVLRT